MALGITAKRTDALLRIARTALRRLDDLATEAIGADDPLAIRAAELRDAAERLVEQLERRRVAEARRGRAGRRRTP